jgi:HK97 family phage prohead protease
MSTGSGPGLERKFQVFGRDHGLKDADVVEGYASLFDVEDRSGDRVRRGAYRVSLDALAASGRTVKMLWQHDPGEPIGVWDEVREDGTGLYVRGRVLREVRRGAEALALLRALAIDGLSIGYRTVRAERSGPGRLLHEVELWEVSLVTFPMLPEARASAAFHDTDAAFADALAAAFAEARRNLA